MSHVMSVFVCLFLFLSLLQIGHQMHSGLCLHTIRNSKRSFTCLITMFLCIIKYPIVLIIRMCCVVTSLRPVYFLYHDSFILHSPILIHTTASHYVSHTIKLSLILPSNYLPYQCQAIQSAHHLYSPFLLFVSRT